MDLPEEWRGERLRGMVKKAWGGRESGAGVEEATQDTARFQPVSSRFRGDRAGEVESLRSICYSARLRKSRFIPRSATFDTRPDQDITR